MLRKSAANKAAWNKTTTAVHTGTDDIDYVVKSKPVKTEKKVSLPRPESAIEAQLALQITLCQLPTPIRNHKFLTDRKLELDFAWPALMIACECQGMAHRIKEKFESDIEKRFLAFEAGWTVLEVSGKTIRDGRAIQWLQKVFKKQLGVGV